MSSKKEDLLKLIERKKFDIFNFFNNDEIYYNIIKNNKNNMIQNMSPQFRKHLSDKNINQINLHKNSPEKIQKHLEEFYKEDIKEKEKIKNSIFESIKNMFKRKKN